MIHGASPWDSRWKMTERFVVGTRRFDRASRWDLLVLVHRKKSRWLAQRCFRFLTTNDAAYKIKSRWLDQRIVRILLTRSSMNSEAPNPAPRRRVCYLRFAGILFCLFVLAILFIQWWKPWLNESERKMLGVWTWQDAPGEITIHYRNDGTLRYTDRPEDRKPAFMRWKIEKGVISGEYSERNAFEYVAKNLIYRRKWKPDECPVKFNADGTITYTLSDGKKRVFIPWSSDQGELLKKAN